MNVGNTTVLLARINRPMLPVPNNSAVQPSNKTEDVEIKWADQEIPIVDFSNDPVKVSMDSAIKWLSICIMVEVMLGLGCTVDLGVLKRHVKRPVGVAIAVVIQFLIMPLLVFLVARATQLHRVAAIVILLTASVPGGSLSNILSYLIQGDMALSMLMTACSSMLAFAFIPFNLFVYGSYWLPAGTDYSTLLPYPTIFLSLALMALPAGVGAAINWKFSKVATRVILVCKVLLIMTMATLAVLSALLYEDSLLRSMPKEMWLFCVFMPLIGYGLGSVLSRCAKLDQTKRRTVAVETGCQNGQLGCAILKVAFPNQLIGSFFLFPLLYSVFQLVEGLLLVALARYRQQRREAAANDKKCPNDDASSRIKTVSLRVIDLMRDKSENPPLEDKDKATASSVSGSNSEKEDTESCYSSMTSDDPPTNDVARVNRSFEDEFCGKQ